MSDLKNVQPLADFNWDEFEVWVVTELRSRDDAVALVADVYDYLFLVDRDYGTLNNLML